MKLIPFYIACLSIFILSLVSCDKKEENKEKPADDNRSQIVKPVVPSPSKPSVVAEPSSVASSGSKMQRSRWNQANIRPEYIVSIDKAIFLYQNNESLYSRLQGARKNGVPSQVIFVLHGRESSWNYKCHLHNGDSLMFRTKHVPKNRLPDSEPPYSFEDSAIDALYDYEGLDKRNWRDLGSVLQNIESYNGLAYQKYHKDVPSPYLWSGTDLYYVGKYSGDGVFSPGLKDRQLGCAAILKRMQERGMELPFK